MGTAPSRPIIVWTFRRTGGTSLKSILFHLTGRPSFEDEALNDDPPRELGNLTAAFRRDHDVDALRATLTDRLRERRNLKHCCETVPFEVTRALFEISLEFNYGHVVLLRLGETDRLISLEIARKTGAWGPVEARRVIDDLEANRIPRPTLNLYILEQQARSDANMLGMLLRMFFAARAPFSLVFFEDLYRGPIQKRCAEFRRVAAAAGIPNAQELPDDVFKASATQTQQNTRAIAALVSNMNEARIALRSIVYEPALVQDEEEQ